jgi:hypothetical protein
MLTLESVARFDTNSPRGRADIPDSRRSADSEPDGTSDRLSAIGGMAHATGMWLSPYQEPSIVGRTSIDRTSGPMIDANFADAALVHEPQTS